MQKSKAGIDGVEFELIREEVDQLPFDRPIINLEGREYGSIKTRKGKVIIEACLPKFLRDDNVRPFSIEDMKHLGDIQKDIQRNLQNALGTSYDIKEFYLKSIECNITQKVVGSCTPSQVINLFNISETERPTVTYQSASKQCKYDKRWESLSISRKNYYLLKVYDKSYEQRKKWNKNVEDGLLRIEIVMQDRMIKKMFGDKKSLPDILKKDSLIKVMGEYKRIFVDETIEKKIRPCLDGIRETLLSTLTETGSLQEALALHRGLIVDLEVLRKTIKKKCRIEGKDDSSRQRIYSLKKYNLPESVLRTIKQFHVACG